mgnify:CR=1 FL=1
MMSELKYYVFHDRFEPVIPTKYFDNLEDAIKYLDELYLTNEQYIALGVDGNVEELNVCFDFVHKYPGQFYVLINDYQRYENKKLNAIKENIENKINIRFQYDSKIYKYGCIIPYEKDYAVVSINKIITGINEVYVSNRTNNIGWMTLNELEKDTRFSHLNHPIIYQVNVSYEVTDSSDSGQMDIDARIMRDV